MCSLEHGADLLRVGHITAHGQSIFRSINGCEVFGRLLTLAIIDDDAGPLTSKRFDDVSAQPAGATGNENNLSRNIQFWPNFRNCPWQVVWRADSWVCREKEIVTSRCCLLRHDTVAGLVKARITCRYVMMPVRYCFARWLNVPGSTAKGWGKEYPVAVKVWSDKAG